MNGITYVGNVLKGNVPASPSVESVQSAKNLVGQTNHGNVNTVKSSSTAGFSTSRKAGSVSGETKTGNFTN